MSLYNDLNEVLTPYANKIKEVNESLDTVAGSRLVTGWQDGYINTSGTTTNMVVASDNTMQYVVVPAAEGDVFSLTMSGAGYGRAWAFIDSARNILSKADSNATLSGQKITAPQDTEFLILNDKKTSPSCYIEFYTKTAVRNIENTVSQVEAQNAERDNLIEKVAYATKVFTGNVIDARTGSTGSPTIIRTYFDDGTYYINPFAAINKEIRLYPKTKYGDAVVLTNVASGTTTQYFGTSARLYVITFKGKAIFVDGYANISEYIRGAKAQSDSYQLAEIPDHWDAYMYGYQSGEAIEKGFTKGFYSEEYLAYVEPTTGYFYTDEFNEHVDDLLDGTLNKIMVPSYNLLDTDYLTPILNGYIYTKGGYYMSVEPGDIITCNALSWTARFYNSSYESVGQGGSPSPYVAVTVPETAVYMTFQIGGANGENFPLVIWKSESALKAKYERPIPRPNKKISGKYLDSDIYDYAVPNSLDQGIMQMARFAAIRADNEKHDAFRFATYNIKSNSGTSNFRNFGDTLFHFAVDFCGIQEINYTGAEFHAACRPFQFGYYAGDYVAEQGYNTILDNACVSRWEVTDTYNIRLYDSENGTSVYKMTLPWHKHYPRRATLSVYNFHGSLQIAKRLAEVDAIIAAIEEDTSDFIIVMGDTNSEVDTSYHRQSWDRLIAAGLTPAHNGESPTWPNRENPSRYSSMDNFFFSSNISCMHYGISDWHAFNYTDHDLVYADLVFDFDTTLKDTWEEPPAVPAPTT